MTYAQRLLDVLPEATVIMTGTYPGRNLPNVILDAAPEETVEGGEAFLNHWQPDILIWSRGPLSPALVSRSTRREMVRFFVEADIGRLQISSTSQIPGLTRATLRSFEWIMSVNEEETQRLKQAGAEPDGIETASLLERGAPALPCQEAERAAIADLLSGRPVWLGAGVGLQEARLCINAHRTASGHTHRLLLILAPHDPEDAPSMEKIATLAGFTAGLRSRGDDPEPMVEVYVADLEDEMGLWYRIAPIVAMGGTFTGDGKSNPREAAALGSAIIAGPQALGTAYEHLLNAGAFRKIFDPARLGLAVQDLLAPDTAAALATAAWSLGSEGAETTDRLVDLTVEALET